MTVGNICEVLKNQYKLLFFDSNFVDSIITFMNRAGS